ncbi:hypothetical protein DFQ26_002120 [Actinomortierella ambigua]|nr:hypothetical protein DFQ26_002120 [Actinomortierella ambigua]
MPPEVYNRKHSSLSFYNPKKADIWALGIMFWQLMFRFDPWRDASYGAEDDFQRYVDNPAAFLLLTPRMRHGSAPLPEPNLVPGSRAKNLGRPGGVSAGGDSQARLRWPTQGLVSSVPSRASKQRSWTAPYIRQR